MVREVCTALAAASRYLPSASQLCWRQEHFAITGRGPGESAALQPFGQQTQPVAGGPQQFDLAAATPPGR